MKTEAETTGGVSFFRESHMKLAREIERMQRLMLPELFQTKMKPCFCSLLCSASSYPQNTNIVRVWSSHLTWLVTCLEMVNISIRRCGLADNPLVAMLKTEAKRGEGKKIRRDQLSVLPRGYRCHIRGYHDHHVSPR